jgi:ABC-type nitrate/sulfonate/bicarbonate transport system permease component
MSGEAAPIDSLPLATRQMRFRGGGFTIRRQPGAPFIAFLAVLLFWELSVRMEWLNPLFLPAPSAIIAALTDLTRSGMIWKHVSISLERIAVGWVLGTIFGIILGVAMGVWSLSRSVGLAFVSALFPIPKVALLPLLILWLGIGEASKIATIGLGVFFPTVIAVYSGIDGVPRNLIQMAQSFGVPPRAILWKVVLPGALPNIIAGFRITTSTALILLVSAEMIGAQYGIGAFVLQAGNMMLTDQLLAGVTLLSILGLLISALLSRAERRLLRWR